MLVKNRPSKLAVSLLIISLSWFCKSVAAEVAEQTPDRPSFTSKSLDDVLQWYSDQGIKLLYSSNYVLPGMKVENEPSGLRPVEQISEILDSFGLKLKRVGDSYLIIKAAADDVPQAKPPIVIILRQPESIANLQALKLSAEPEISNLIKHDSGLYEYYPEQSGTYSIVARLPGYLPFRATLQYDDSSASLLMINLQEAPPGIEEISVSASRYILFSSSDYVIEKKNIEVSPLLGRDPVLSVQRLQSTAAGGLSAKSHYRGGLDNESSIYLNGLRLIEPYHIRDYHSIFSTVAAQLVESIQVYTGGFPVEYGDDMSGVMLLQTKAPNKPMHTELGLSLFYASLLNYGQSERQTWDWLVSARRSNLEYVLNPEYGEPEYFDVFTSLGFSPNDRTRITLNMFYTDDEVRLILEPELDELEQSLSNTINKTIWMTLESDWNPAFTSSSTLAFTEFSNDRIASVNNPQELISSVSDFRNMNRINFRHDAKLVSNFGHNFKWGLEFSRQKVKYNYQGEAQYFGFVANSPEIQNPAAYQIEVNPEGNSYALFLSDRLLISDGLSIELGLRWDKQTYTDTGKSSQLSPRASVLYDFRQNGELRFTAGRFYQAQQIQEMQVEDGVDHFYPAQYADQLIGGYQWTAFSDYSFRVEAYYKKYKQLAPRYENLYDPLQLTPEFQPDRVMLSPDSAEAKGLELSVEYVAGEHFSWWASYTWSKVTDSFSGVDQYRSWDQPNALQAGLAWALGAWDIGMATRLHTGWPTTALTIAYDPTSDEAYPVAGPRNVERYETFASLDFRVARKFNVRWGDLTGFFEVTNATNRSNVCCVDYSQQTDAAGQTYLSAKTENWLPIVPSIGVIWQF